MDDVVAPILLLIAGALALSFRCGMDVQDHRTVHVTSVQEVRARAEDQHEHLCVPQPVEQER